jgi:predicted TIM-barrel enzyme
MMPYGDANAIVMDMAREVLPVARETAVLAGVCGTDPFRLMPNFLQDVKRAGFTGVQNFPTVGLIDGTFRVGLEETGMGYGLEVEMIRAAHELDLLTCPYVFDEDEARAMAQAGADVLVPHMGLTTGGTIGSRSGISLDEAVARVQACGDAAREVNPTSSACATAARSPSPTTRSTSSSAPPASSASSAPRAWSACRPRSP